MTVKTIKLGNIPTQRIQCLECDSIVEYDKTDIKYDGYRYFFGHAMDISLEYIICSNCSKPIFLDGKTRLPDQSKQVLHD